MRRQVAHKLGIPLVIAATLLAGCANQEQTELREWMREEAKGMRGKVPPLPEITPFPPVNYEGRGETVPFSQTKLATVETAADKAKLASDRPRQPLEGFPLEDLRVTGIIVKDGVPYAMIAPPAPQKPKHVRVGEFMGQNFGKITAISTSAVTILETTKDNNGAWVEREVIKPVPRQGESK